MSQLLPHKMTWHKKIYKHSCGNLVYIMDTVHIDISSISANCPSCKNELSESNLILVK